MKPIKPEYLFWKNRVEGQIRHMINEHPEYFSFKDEDEKGRCIRSMAKRIIGEIVAGTLSGDKVTATCGGDKTVAIQGDGQTDSDGSTTVAVGE